MPVMTSVPDTVLLLGTGLLLVALATRLARRPRTARATRPTAAAPAATAGLPSTTD